MDRCDVVKPSVGSLGPALDHLYAALGCSWGLCGQSRAISGAFMGNRRLLLGPSVGGLGLLLGPQLAALS